jgi:hypothetical protein
MQHTLLPVLLLVAAVPQGPGEVVEGPSATGKLDGKKVRFPAKTIEQGVKATVELLESCCSHDDGSIPYTVAELKNAQAGDHVRLVFPKPITVFGGKVEVSELIFTQPSNTGVFWLRSGDKVRRYTKFQFQKQKAFEMWLRQAQPAD